MIRTPPLCALGRMEVCEHGDQITPSGKNATVVARWSPEHQAFLQIDPGNALKHLGVNFWERRRDLLQVRGRDLQSLSHPHIATQRAADGSK